MRGEQFLAQALMSSAVGYLSSLLVLSGIETIDINVRLQSAVLLGKTIEKNWFRRSREKVHEYHNYSGVTFISAGEKATI